MPFFVFVLKKLPHFSLSHSDIYSLEKSQTKMLWDEFIAICYFEVIVLLIAPPFTHFDVTAPSMVSTAPKGLVLLTLNNY